MGKETTTTEQAQPMLLPDQPLDFTEQELLVEALPPDADLAGGAPPRELVETMRTLGLLHPIIVGMRPGQTKGGKKGGSATYHIVAGRRRLKAARILGWEHITARVFEEDGLIDATASLAESVRTDNPMADLEVIERLMGEGLTEGEISKASGMAVGTIAKRLKMRGLHPQLRQAVQASQMTVSAAIEATKLTQEQQEGLVAQAEETGRVRIGDVKEVRRVQVDATAAQALSGLEGQLAAAQAGAMPPTTAEGSGTDFSPIPLPEGRGCRFCGQNAFAALTIHKREHPMCGQCAQTMVEINASLWKEAPDA